jgi:hypothetical protein
MIDTALVLGLPEPVETYSSSEHLFEMLNIPAGSTGRMTKQKAAQPEKAKSDSGKSERSRPAAKSEEKSSEPRVKRERTRTKRISD